mgnify:CR=1 FL=1
MKDSWGAPPKLSDEKNQKETEMSEEEGQIGTWDNQKVTAKKIDSSWGAKETGSVKASDTWGDGNKTDSWGTQKPADEPAWGNQNTNSDRW